MSIGSEQLLWVLFAAFPLLCVLEVVRSWRAARGLVPRKRPLISSWVPEQMLVSDGAWQAGHRAMIPGHVVILVLAVALCAVALAEKSWWLFPTLFAISGATVLNKHRGARAAAAVTDRPSI